MLKAKDIMAKEVVSVKMDTPIQKALDLLLENQVAGMPVVNEDMTLVGIVTEKDLLALFSGSQGAEGKTVEDFMTQPAVHFDESESLQDICKCLQQVAFRRVPVTSEGKVVGIISRPDVLRCVRQRFRHDTG